MYNPIMLEISFTRRLSFNTRNKKKKSHLKTN